MPVLTANASITLIISIACGNFTSPILSFFKWPGATHIRHDRCPGPPGVQAADAGARLGETNDSKHGFHPLSKTSTRRPFDSRMKRVPTTRFSLA